MKIVVCGAGKLGYAVIAALKQEAKYEIILIDREESVLRDACNALDVHGVCGDAAEEAVLRRAGVPDVDLVIALTGDDAANIRSASTAGALGVYHTMARVREPNHRKEGSIVARHLGIRLVLNPEREAAMEIARLLRLPAAVYAETFAAGRAELVAFRVTENDRVLLGSPVAKVLRTIHLPVLFGIVVRGEETFIPRGDFYLQEGDLVYVLGQPGDIMAFFTAIGKYVGKVDRCMIIGGGEIAYYLGKALEGMGIKSAIIETNPDRVALLRELLPECDIIQGDGTNDRTLLERHITTMGAVAALTGRDEQNLLVGMHAGRMGVARIIAKINRSGYRRMAMDMGIERIVMPQEIIAERVIEYVRALQNGRDSDLTAMYRLAAGKAEAMEFMVGEDCPVRGKPFSSLAFRAGVLVACIIRNNALIIPSGNDHLEAGDSVVILSSGAHAERLADVFDMD